MPVWCPVNTQKGTQELLLGSVILFPEEVPPEKAQR